MNTVDGCSVHRSLVCKLSAPPPLDIMLTVYYIVNMSFGDYVRAARSARAEDDLRYSLRQVAHRVGVEPAYLSKVERGLVPPPSEATIVRLAKDLGEDPDVLLALAGKVGSDLQAIILRRPKQFAELIRQLKNAPDHALLKVVREVRDGKW
jgi:transcriptional regulator with XRE-family HTH domain